MTAYNAAISLTSTIHDILFSCRLSLVFPSVEILLLASEELQPLQEILKRLDSTSKGSSRKKVNALDGRIRETLWNFQDLLESLVTDEIVSQFGSPHPDQPKLRWEIHRRNGRILQQVEGEEPLLSGLELELNKEMYIRRLLYEQIRSSVDGRDLLLFSIDLQRLQDDVYSFIHTLNNIVEEYIMELDNMAAEEDEDDEDEESISSLLRSEGYGGTRSKMIGLSDQFEQVKGHMLREFRWKQVWSLFGTPGVGKTTLAKEIYEDPSISSHFECRAWVTVGRKCRSDRVSRQVLAQLDPNMDINGTTLKDYLSKRLVNGKKCLIVVDDVWEARVLDSLLSSLPDMGDGIIQILLTARDRNVIANIDFGSQQILRFKDRWHADVEVVSD